MEDRSIHKATVLSGPQIVVLPDYRRFVGVVAKITIKEDGFTNTSIDCVVIGADDRLPEIGEELQVIYYGDFFDLGSNPDAFHAGWFCWAPQQLPQTSQN